jgi:hypothetical protein
MTTTTAPAFRFLGITDDATECARCGRTELRSTVVLAVLDADGNTEDVTYFGSSCAAQALGYKANRGAAVLALARNAHEQLERETRQALEFLAFLGVDVQGRPMFTRDGVTRLWGPAARRYRMANPVRFGTERAATGMVEDVQAAVARKLAILADAFAVGVLTR